MHQSTKQLVARLTKKAAAPAAIVAAFALGAAVFVGHGRVNAASGAAMPMDDSSVSALTALDHAMEAVASRVTPSVVTVDVTSRGNEYEQEDGQQQQQMQLPPGFQQFFGPMFQQPQQPQLERGVGSGVIVSPDGYILTNDHVVDGAVQIKVMMNDRRVLSAKVIGVDKLNDLAVIKVNATNLPTIAWGDSTKLEPGQTVLAFGSPFGYFRFSVTRGIVSAIGRGNPYSDNPRKPGDYIQTDAAINPGNSGGPLVDARGELVGINTFIITNSGSFAGAGFAIPSQIAHATAEQLIAHGKIEHGYLGISINDVTPANAHFFGLDTATGAIVSQVTPESPAGNAGMKTGDVVRELNGQKIVNASALQVAVSEMNPGTKVTLGIERNGKPMTIDVTVGQFHSNGEEAENTNGGEQKGKLGISVSDLTPNARQQANVPDGVHGVIVNNVRPGSPADDAGIQPGDVIQEIDRKPVTSASQFVDQVHGDANSSDVLLLVWSKGNSVFVTVHPDQGSQNG
jgi:serine protease Do